MNIRNARDEVSLLFPANASYGVPAQGYPTGAGRKPTGLAARLRRGVAWILELPRRHAVLAQLETMTDRELADIGLARGELSKVFDGDGRTGFGGI